jgi:hypothetical protein
MAHREWEALDEMFQRGLSSLDDQPAPAASYGKDAPVKVTGPTPGMIGPPAVPAKKKAAAAAKPTPKADANEIWSEAEVANAGEEEDEDDGRAQPEYDLVFRQNVTPEDNYLGVDPLRHGGLSCADELILKVTLPDTKLADVDLDVRPTFVRVSAPQYRLKVQLGERVDEGKGTANWDAAKSLLTVNMPIIHDFDTKFTTTSSANELD